MWKIWDIACFTNQIQSCAASGNCHADVTECDESGDEDADDGDADVLEQLHPHDGVSLPVDVGQRDGEARVGPRDLRQTCK